MFPAHRRPPPRFLSNEIVGILQFICSFREEVIAIRAGSLTSSVIGEDDNDGLPHRRP